MYIVYWYYFQIFGALNPSDISGYLSYWEIHTPWFNLYLTGVLFCLLLLILPHKVVKLEANYCWIFTVNYQELLHYNIIN